MTKIKKTTLLLDQTHSTFTFHDSERKKKEFCDWPWRQFRVEWSWSGVAWLRDRRCLGKEIDRQEKKLRRQETVRGTKMCLIWQKCRASCYKTTIIPPKSMSHKTMIQRRVWLMVGGMLPSWKELKKWYYQINITCDIFQKVICKSNGKERKSKDKHHDEYWLI